MMKRMFGGACLLGALVFGGAAEANAQVFTPTYMSPRASSDIGLYLSDGPGEFAAEGILRRHFGSFDIGVRGGIADTHDLSFMVGGEFRHPVAVTSPVDLAATAGVQGIFGGIEAIGFQGGLSVGYTFAAEGLEFTPYVHPRVAFARYFEGGDFDADLLADVGFDLGISQNLSLRFGIALDGNGSDWGVGFAWR